MKKTLLLFVLIVSRLSFSQNNEDNHFSLFVSGGTSINNPANWYFYGNSEDEMINPGLYGNIGFEYGPINLIDLSQLYFSTSIGFTKVSAQDSKLEFNSSSAKLEIETIPILIWLKLKTNTLLSPFVEIGIGISKLNFQETYSNNLLEDAAFNYWAFSYGFGAGINYKISDSFEIALVVQILENEREKIVEINRDYETGIWVRNVVVPVSLRVSLNI